MSFTHSIREPSYIWPHIADGSINPFHKGIFLIRWTLYESPSILQLLSQPEVSSYSGYRCQSFYSVSNIYDTVYSCVPKSKSHAAKGFLSFCWNCVPKSINSAWVYDQYIMKSVTLRAPWGCPLGHRLLMLHFLLYNGPHCQVGTCSLRTLVS